MTGFGRFLPHAPQHHRMLPQGPLNGKTRPIPAIPKKERSRVLLVAVVEPYEARAMGDQTKSKRGNS